ncbi:MAG: hypothetical protein J0H99_03880, partial [Rhodospirillales bacterium]|nr:hypothetical protein [Rhodospirillales bacterium]
MSAHPNRHQRRAAAAKARDKTPAPDMQRFTAEAVRFLDQLAAADPTVTGATLITPDGRVRYLDAATL